MGHDLQVWTVRAPDLAAMLHPPASWARRGRAFVRKAGTWRVVVHAAEPVEPEEVPDRMSAALPGIGFRTGISVEPAGAPKRALDLAARTARAIARSARGVVLDPKSDGISTPAGLRRFVPARRPDRFPVIGMTWWFRDGPLLERKGLDAFVDCLARLLPEALPKRYGPRAPPEHRLEETGLDHFREFLAGHYREVSGLVWHPHRPVCEVAVHPETHWGVGPQVFRCGYATLSVERSALAQPGWQAGLRAFWVRASHVIRPFFGDVRTLHGFIPRGDTFATDTETEFHPVGGPFWRGVPEDPGHACVAGPEYLRLWSGLRQAARIEGGLGFVTTEDWEAGGSVVASTGPVPVEIAMKPSPAWTVDESGEWSRNWTMEYPPRWPFDDAPPRATGPATGPSKPAR